MFRTIAVVMLVFGLCGIDSGIARASDKDKFGSLIGKYGSDDAGCVPGTFKPKSACFCTDPGAMGLTGFVARYSVGGFTYVQCLYPYFNVDGSLNSCGACNAFQLLAK